MNKRVTKYMKKNKNIIEENPDVIYLERLIKEKVLEVWRTPQMPENQWNITYMYNDAVESVIVLEQAAFTGDYQKELDNLELELVKEKERYAVLGKQEKGNCFAIWFSDFHFEYKLYQYHEIGHFWVKGAEHLRQLVYEIGLIQDKYEYLGEQACSKKERKLLSLLEFAPFRAYYSVPWEEEEKFYSTKEGIEAFLQLVQEAGDRSLETLIRKYKRENEFQSLFLKESKRKKCIWDMIIVWYRAFSLHSLEEKIKKCINQSGHEAAYEVLREKVIGASSEYDIRSFGAQKDAFLQQKRLEFEKQWQSEGWCGTYPDYEKTEGKWYMQMHIVEELPFTVEEKNYRLHQMISYSRVSKKNRTGMLKRKVLRQKISAIKERDSRKKMKQTVKDSIEYVNMGFFNGKCKAEIRTLEVIEENRR